MTPSKQQKMWPVEQPAHTCHALGCDKTVPPRLLMCGRHWAMVPKPLQRTVWATYQPGQEDSKDPSGAYLAAAKAAIAAVARQEGAREPRG
jgi:hypothetical protein